MKKIVILGAGFAGVSAYKELIKSEGKNDHSVIVVNRHDYFLFTPLLHEVAACHIEQSDPVVSLLDIFREGEFVKAEISGIDLDKREVKTSAGDIFYDYLIICPGAETNFYGIPGAREYALTLKSLEDAARIRRLVVERMEEAAFDKNNEGDTDFVIVGAGATGVELAAELADLFNRTVRPHLKRKEESFRIFLLDGDREVLSRFPKYMRDSALKALNISGVILKLGVRAVEVSPDGLAYEEGGKNFFLKSKNIIWAAGVSPAGIDVFPQIKKDKGRIVTNKFLMTEAPQVFAVGDVAVIGEDPSSSPYLAQAAELQGRVAAINIIASMKGRPLLPFRYKPKGQLVSLGRFRATGEVGILRMGGFLGWWLWRTVYLIKMPSFKKKVVLALRWTLDLFFRRELTEVD